MRLFLICLALIFLCYELMCIHSALDKIAFNTTIVSIKQEKQVQDSLKRESFIFDSTGIHLPKKTIF